VSAAPNPVPAGVDRRAWFRERLAQAAYLARRNRRRGAPAAPVPNGPLGRAARPATNRRRRGSRRAAAATRGDPDGDGEPSAGLGAGADAAGDHPRAAGSSRERARQRPEFFGVAP
jgi:hypothetical protein